MCTTSMFSKILTKIRYNFLGNVVWSWLIVWKLTMQLKYFPTVAFHNLLRMTPKHHFILLRINKSSWTFNIMKRSEVQFTKIYFIFFIYPIHRNIDKRRTDKWGNIHTLCNCLLSYLFKRIKRRVQYYKFYNILYRIHRSISIQETEYCGCSHWSTPKNKLFVPTSS